MIKVVLFDLDDTLLGNDIDVFMPHYLALIGDYASAIIDQAELVSHLMACTELTIQNQDPAITNRDVFWTALQQRTGWDPTKLEPFFDHFYRHSFQTLRQYTQFRPEAVALVKACKRLGLPIVIATNPLFPLVAVESRLAWAGLPVADNEFALVTAMENMHSSKPHLSYYEEILQKVRCRPDEALMVGDSWYHDIEPAASLGMATYWVAAPAAVPPQPNLVAAFGSMTMLLDKVNDGWLAQAALFSQGSRR